MTEKNKRLAELKARRKPPMPSQKKTKTLAEKKASIAKKYGMRWD